MVPNSTDVIQSPRIEAEKNKKMAFVGRFSPEKDPVTAARAAHIAAMPIMFIGTGPLNEDIRIANPEAKMRGWRTPSEVQELLKVARGILFPSVWYEGQPLVIDEAAALGLPVIISDVSAATYSVDKYRHGLTFEASNVDALVRRIKEFEHDDVVKSFSEAGYNNYWKNPSTMTAHVTNLVKVYEEILSEI
jgi:glycosyltransferase involved in cell wall biosynthesis